MTSSPSPIPRNRKMDSSHAVAEFRHTALLVPQNSAIFFSNSFVFGPVVIQPLFNASTTPCTSFSEISGGENGIFFLFVIFPHSFSCTKKSLEYSKLPFSIIFFLQFQGRPVSPGFFRTSESPGRLCVCAGRFCESCPPALSADRL